LGRGEEPLEDSLKVFKIIFSVTSINSKDAIRLLIRTYFSRSKYQTTPLQKPPYNYAIQKKGVSTQSSFSIYHVTDGIAGNIYKCNFDYAPKKYRFVGSLF
jgi:hypothetical protein